MASPRILMLLAMLACIMAAVFARADDDDFEASAPVTTEDEDDTEEDYATPEKEKETQFIDTRAIFVGHEDEAVFKFPAGEKVSSFVSFQNKLGGNPAELFIVAAHLNPVGNPNAFIQNFSAVRTVRTVNGGETATVRFEFRPDAMLEPMDYNLAIRVFFLSEDNATFVSAAFNGTVTITDPLGIDYKGITTYFILAGLIGGAVYLFSGSNDSAVAAAAKKAGNSSASPSAASPKKAASAADEIADDKAFNAEYISPEHLKYREQLLAASNRAGSPKKKSPASPKKK